VNLLGTPYIAFQRFLLRCHSIVLGGTATGPKIEASGANVKVPGLNIAGTALTATAAQLNLAAAGVTGAPLQAQRVSFTETTGAGTYTGSISVPAGALIIDIKVWSTVLWDTQTSATMKVGDTDDDGWYTGINLKATDLLVGEEINFENLGGKQGVYLVAATGLRSAAYSASARLVTGIITTVGTTGSAGRTFMSVLYTNPTATAATKA